MESFPDTNTRRERLASPAEGLSEFLETYNEIMALIGWLVECKPGADPGFVAVKRAHLSGLFQSLHLDPDDPASMNTLIACHNDVTARARAPQPEFDVPDVGFFKERIAMVTADRSADPDAPISAYNASVSEVAAHAWTDWSAVQSRSSDTSTPEYIRGVATIVADPIAYELVFPRVDEIQITPQWEVFNGRHRSLAVACLGFAAVEQANSWVPVSAAY